MISDYFVIVFSNHRPPPQEKVVPTKESRFLLFFKAQTCHLGPANFPSSKYEANTNQIVSRGTIQPS